MPPAIQLITLVREFRNLAVERDWLWKLRDWLTNGYRVVNRLQACLQLE